MTVKRACALEFHVQRKLRFSSSINYQDCYSEDPDRCKNVRSTGRTVWTPLTTDPLHILQLKYFHKEITSCASLIPTVPWRSQATDFWWNTIYTIYQPLVHCLDTAGYTLRWLLAQRLSSLLPPLSTISILIQISINVYNGPTYQLLAVSRALPSNKVGLNMTGLSNARLKRSFEYDFGF